MLVCPGGCRDYPRHDYLAVVLEISDVRSDSFVKRTSRLVAQLLAGSGVFSVDQSRFQAGNAAVPARTSASIVRSIAA